MSPTIIRYKNISIRIYPEDHKPIHVHAHVEGGYGVKVIFDMRDKEILKINYEDLKDRQPLTPAMKRDVKKLVNSLKATMVEDFNDIVIKKRGVSHDTILISKL